MPRRADPERAARAEIAGELAVCRKRLRSLRADLPAGGAAAMYVGIAADSIGEALVDLPPPAKTKEAPPPTAAAAPIEIVERQFAEGPAAPLAVLEPQPAPLPQRDGERLYRCTKCEDLLFNDQVALHRCLTRREQLEALASHRRDSGSADSATP